MKKLLILLLCAPLWAQNTKSGSITGTTCFGIDTTNAGTVGISVQNSSSGSAWTGTIQPQAAIGGDPASNIAVTPAGSTTPQTTITANGVYYAAISGSTYVQVCGNTVTNTAAIKMFPAQYSKNFGGSGGTLPVGLTFSPPTLTISTAGSGNGTLALSGNTSGTCTLTGSATSTVITNSCSLTTAGVALATGTGVTWPSAAALFYDVTRGSLFWNNQANSMSLGVGSLGWYSGAAGSSGFDTSISRSAAGVMAFGNASVSTGAALKAAALMSVGTTFTSNAGCGDTTLTGGATAGKYTSVTAGTCTTIITMGNTATAPNGWSCSATDLTTAADAGNIHQTATTTTTASLNETTVVANDVIQFSCIGY